MKLEQLKKIYSDKVAELITDGWTIDPFIRPNGIDTAVVLERDGVRRVVYMREQFKAAHMCQKSITIGCAIVGVSATYNYNTFHMADCSEKDEQVFVEVKGATNWFLTPDELVEVFQKQSARYNAKRHVGMFRVYMGKDENPSPEACRTALKLVRRVQGFGNTALKNIVCIWFESGTDMACPNWDEQKPTLCVRVNGKGSPCRIKMPCCVA